MLRISRTFFMFSKKVRVEFCMAWRFDSDFDALKDQIQYVDKKIEV